jgi:hypothetical protein
MKALHMLKSTDHSVIEKVFKSVTNDKENVSENFFEGTVFSTPLEFSKMQKMIGDSLVASISKEMIETPLINERGNASILYTSSTEKGMGFGLIFIDYRKKNPLLVLYVDKTQTGYSYESARFDNGTWVDGLSLNFNASTLKEFLEDISENLDNDVRFFTNKY